MSKMRDADMPLVERIGAAIERIAHGRAAMRVPVEATDPDVVLGDCQREIDRLTAERDEHARWREKLADDLHERESQISDGWAALRASGVQSEESIADGITFLRFMNLALAADKEALRAAVEREPLSDWRIGELYRQWLANPETVTITDLMRAVERAHGIGGSLQRSSDE